MLGVWCSPTCSGTSADYQGVSSQPISFADLSDEQLVAEVKRQHERDLAHGVGAVVLPYTLDRKYPNAATEWAWQFVFPASRVCRDARWGPPSRYHLSRVGGAACGSGGHATGRCPQACRRHQHDDDLYARPQSRCIGSAKSGRSSVIGRRAWRLCASPGVAQAYGSFPTGWSYRTGRSRRQAVRKVQFGDLLRGSNMSSSTAAGRLRAAGDLHFCIRRVYAPSCGGTGTAASSKSLFLGVCHTILVGCFGAAVAAILMVFDMTIVRIVRSTSTIKGAG